jgi:hypothetical protein
MLDEQKVDDIFTHFIRGGNGSDDIKQIYETMPYLNNDQQRVLSLLNALAVKYDSPVLQELADSIVRFAKSNRRTGFKFSRLIESYSLYKHFKGYSMSGSVNDDKK